jgi:hypothetical protein
MASTYVNDLRLNEMATGDASGTWGTTTNTNLELIGEAFSYGTEAITTNADTHTTTIADGATDPGRALYLKYTGTLDSACTITIGPNTVSKLWFIENGTTGSQNIILSQGSGANITIPAGDTKVVYSDGAGSGAAFVDAFASLSVVDLKVQDDLTVTGDIDVDGTTNLDVVDIDGAVDMASTALVTGVLTTTAATVFNGGFASNAASTISTADNSAQITLVSTDADASVGPLLDLYRNSASPADDDIVGQIRMQGENSAGETINYVTLFSQIQDVTDGIEDGRFFISAMTGGTDYSRMDLLSNESVFNQDSQDLDFRVESDSNTHALFVQGSDGNVGIGTTLPTSPLTVNRLSTDGTIASFEKDGTTVGSIGTVGDVLTIGNGDTGLLFSGSGDYITPRNPTTQAGRDAAIDLGTGSDRFKDLYLSGGVYLGGTVAANLLDDYEEGTWTPTVAGGTAGYTVQTGRYTKIGNIVRLRCAIKLSSWSGTGTVTITGIPFTCVTAAFDHDWSVAYLASKPNANTWVCGVDTSTVFFRQQNSTNADTALAHTDIDADTAILFTVVYQTTQ